MNYDEVKQAYFPSEPLQFARPAVMTDATPARRLRDGIEPLAMHAVWSRGVNEMLARHGLDFMGGYVWARATSLGDPCGAVVAATFAAFEPGFLAPVYDVSRACVPRDILVVDLNEAVGRSLRAVLGDGDPSGTTEALARAVHAADATGRALFAGVRSLPTPSDPFAALWQVCLALREYRGDSHVAAYVAAGYDPVQMNILTELWAGYPIGEYSRTRGWSPARTETALASLRAAGLIDGDAITAKGRTARDAIEATTDALCDPLVTAIGSDIEWVLTQVDQWSQSCITAGAFPPDIRKLACG